MPAQGTETRHIRVEFAGGYWADKSFDTRSTSPEEQQLAQVYYRMHRKGTLDGFLFRLSMAAVRLFISRGWSTDEMRVAGYDGRHSYVLSEKLETDRSVVLRFRFAPASWRN